MFKSNFIKNIKPISRYLFVGALPILYSSYVASAKNKTFYMCPFDDCTGYDDYTDDRDYYERPGDYDYYNDHHYYDDDDDLHEKAYQGTLIKSDGDGDGDGDDVDELSTKELDVHNPPEPPTPIMLAIDQCNLAAVKLLLDSGANPKQTDQFGRTLLHMARCTEQEHMLVLDPSSSNFRAKSLVNILLDAGVEADTPDFSGKTAIDELDTYPLVVNQDSLKEYKIKQDILLEIAFVKKNRNDYCHLYTEKAILDLNSRYISTTETIYWSIFSYCLGK